MSEPFSFTHLRVPRGFGTILEGLAREILRDQPEDIPKYAAQYFDALLKKREDSGMDPAGWAAKLEDRFYYNNAFKAIETSPNKETEVTISKQKSYESQTDEESSYSAEASVLSATQPNVSEAVDLSESTGEEDKHDITDKHAVLMENEPIEEQSDDTLPAAEVLPDELSRTEEAIDPTITTSEPVDSAANENDSSSDPDQTIPQTESEPSDMLSLRGHSSVDVCAQELGMREDEECDKEEAAVVGMEIVAAEEEGNTEDEEPVEVIPHSRLADVDVCATELVGTEKTVEENDAHAIEDETSKPEPEESFVHSAVSQTESPEDNEEEAEDQAAKTKEEEGTESQTSGGIHESLTHTEAGLDSNVIPKEDSLVEISFEDVPGAQQIKDIGEKQPEEEDSVEVLETTSETKQEEESNEVTAVAPDQDTSCARDNNEPEVVRVEKEVMSEGEESQHEASDIIKEVGVNDSKLNDSEDDEMGESVKTTSEANEESAEQETHDKREDTGNIGETDLHHDVLNDPDFEKAETTHTAEADKDDVHTESYSEVEDQEINDGAENHSSQVTHPNISTTAIEEESETHLPEESEESHGALEGSRPEDTGEEKEGVTSKAEDFLEEGKTHSEIQENDDATHEEGSVSPTQSADRHTAGAQGEERPVGSEDDGGLSGDKQEDCSRPQEEEDIMDIPLDDPEANRAAAKIQAGFRGHMTRKKMKPEDKAEGEEVSSTGDVLNGSQGDTETGGSGAVERDDTSVPEQ